MTAWQLRRALSVLIVAASGAACGAAERVDEEGAPPLSAQATAVVNSCPEFGWWLLLPKSLPLGETTEIVVNVTDPDAPKTRLHFDWAASSGAFSYPYRAETSYTCQAVGTHELVLEARDESDCTSTLLLDVFCLDPAR